MAVPEDHLAPGLYGLTGDDLLEAASSSVSLPGFPSRYTVFADCGDCGDDCARLGMQAHLPAPGFAEGLREVDAG